MRYVPKCRECRITIADDDFMYDMSCPTCRDQRREGRYLLVDTVRNRRHLCRDKMDCSYASVLGDNLTRYQLFVCEIPIPISEDDLHYAFEQYKSSCQWESILAYAEDYVKRLKVTWADLKERTT